MFWFNKNVNNKGFTLIEMLVSISILALISTVFVVNYRAGERSSNFRLTVQKTASDIRLAQNYTLGLREFDDGINPPDFPEGGWGVYFNTAQDGQYVIFADEDESRFYESNNNNGVNEEFRTADLPDGIAITSVDVGSPVSIVSIVFEPPDPTTYITTGSPGGPTFNAVNITLSNTNTTKDIVVNFLGLIDVE